MSRAPRFITSLTGKIRALTGERTLKTYATKNQMTIKEATAHLLNEYNANIQTQRDRYYAEKRVRDSVKRKTRSNPVEKQARAQARTVLNQLDFTNAQPNSEVTAIYEMLRQYVGRTVVLVWRVNKKYRLNWRFELPGENEYTRMMHANWNVFWQESHSTVFTHVRENEPNSNQTVSLYEANLIPARNIRQYFRDGEKHCVLEPIRLWAEGVLSQQTQPRGIRKYTKIVKDCAELMETYSDGIPESDLSIVCNRLNIDIKISLPFCKEPLVFAKSDTKRLKLFCFKNTRVNHVEYGGITQEMTEPTTATREELNELYHQYTRDDVYFEYSKDKCGISRIDTMFGSHAIKSDYRVIADEFETATGLNNCKVDDVKNSKLSHFLQAGVHYNGTVDFQDTRGLSTDSVIHGDMQKAYTQGKKCKYYSGYLGKVTDFRKTNKMVGIGIYQIKNLNWSNADKTLKQYNDVLNIYRDGAVYPSCELEMLIEHGVQFDIVAGAWGSTIDFEFPESMLQKTENGMSYYAIWAGGCDSHNLKRRFYMNGCPELASHIVLHTGATVESYDKLGNDFGEICVSFPKEHNYSAPHVTAFITAYQRLNVIEQLLSMDITKIVRLCVDGIYTYEDVKWLNAFRLKNKLEDKTFANPPCVSSYISSAFWTNFSPGSARDHYMKELHLGAGGCGKTHEQLTDNGFVNPLFIAPSYKLIRAKQAEYGCSTEVIANLFSPDPVKTDRIKKYHSVFIIDEVSMVSKDDMQRIFTLYPGMKIVCCGDIGYQLPPILGTPVSENMFDNVVCHKKDFRCKCPKLKEVKEHLRMMIATNTPTTHILAWAKKNIPNMYFAELSEEYNVNDLILAGTNAMKDSYTKMLTGTREQEKYYVTKNTRAHSNGEIIIGDAPDAPHEIRHAFTCHSIQGETLKAPNRLFIDIKTMGFQPQLLYTAVSRAEYMSQIILVNNEPKV